MTTENPKKKRRLQANNEPTNTMSRTYAPYKPTEEDIKKRHAEMKKMGGQMIDLKSLRKYARLILSEKNKTDIGFSWIKHYGDFSIYNKEEMTGQMKQWKDLAKQGKLTVYEENNTEHDIEGKKIYCLVITPVGNETSFCPMSLALGVLVSGYTYAFTKKENRDAIFAYIKKNSL